MTLRVMTCLTVLALSGCNKLASPDTRLKFEVLIRTTTPEGQPVKGTQILLDSKPIGVTSDLGTAVLPFTANEGESYDLAVQCPQGLQSPARPISVTLRKLADSKRPEFEALCAPTSQLVLVAVRAENGPNLPVLYLGNEIGRTDASGAALVGVRLPPNESFELKLDTTGKDAALLRPENPSTTFPVKNQDDVLIFDQKFKLEKVKVKAVGKASGPTKIR